MPRDALARKDAPLVVARHLRVPRQAVLAGITAARRFAAAGSQLCANGLDGGRGGHSAACAFRPSAHHNEG
eukprot:2668590-Prymnesium_polylepis.1